jgi:uncharacterized membrane protein
MSRQACTAVVCAFGTINLAGGLMFYAVGAWPILVFCAASVFIIAIAFNRNFHGLKEYERIVIDGDRVTLAKIDPDGTEKTVHFNRKWLTVDLEYDEFREIVGRLFLRSSGKSHEIAAFLGAEERRSLAKALRCSF